MSTTLSADAWTIGRVLTWSTDFLRERGLTDSPRLDAELLLAHALSMRRIQLYTHFDQPLTVVEREPFKSLLKRRGAGEPVAYITGEKEFMGFTFKVGPAVLVPRPDTEVLVETVLAWAKDRPPLRLLDVGTGSGCIAVSLALKLAGARVAAWDIEPAALALAQVNAESLGANVAFHAVDALAEESWLATDASAAGDGLFDVIVSNPPYISPDEAKTLPISVVEYEPKRALFAEPDGLLFYRKLGELAPRRLAPGGRLVVEIGSTQAKDVAAILRAAGWSDVQIHKDYSKLDRVVAASLGGPGSQ